jgi:DNA-binding ferritin-like protein
MEESIKRRTENLEKNLRADLLQIKKGDALLNGDSKDKEVKAALKNFRFEDQFKDPACRSFFNDRNFKSMAKKGYRGIEEAINAKNSELNPTAFLAKSSQLEKEIKELGSHISRKHKNADGLEAKPGDLISGFTPRILNTDSKAISRILKNTNDEIKEENKQVIRELQSTIPKGDKTVASLMQDVQAGIERGTIDLGFRLSEFEKEAKNNCLGSYIKDNFGGVDGFTKRLQDPNVSEKANEEADSSFKNYIEEILSDNRMTIETKKKKISQAQNKGANQRYGMVTGKSITVEGKNISASTRMPASSMVDMFVDNCVARFDSEPDPSTGKSYRDVVNAVKKL